MAKYMKKGLKKDKSIKKKGNNNLKNLDNKREMRELC